jgi:hypothetical protein
MPTAPRVTRKGTVTTIDPKGPFFTNDINKVFWANARAMMEATAAEGEADAKAQIESHSGEMPGWSGWALGLVRGRVQSIEGKHWVSAAVVSPYTGDLMKYGAIKAMAEYHGRRKPMGRQNSTARGIEERWHIFRVTRNRLRKAKAVNRAELLKGLV